MIIALVVISCLLSLLAVVLIVVYRPKPNNNLFALSYKLDDLLKKLDTITDNLKEDFRMNRDELTQSE